MSAVSQRGPPHEEAAERAPQRGNWAASLPRYGATAAKCVSKGCTDMALQQPRGGESASHGSGLRQFATSQSSPTKDNDRLPEEEEEEEERMGGKWGGGRRVEKAASHHSLCDHRECLCPKKPRYDDDNEWRGEPAAFLHERNGGGRSVAEGGGGETGYAGQDGAESQQLSPANRDCNTNYFTAAENVISSDSTPTDHGINRSPRDHQETILQLNKRCDVLEAVGSSITDFAVTSSEFNKLTSSKEQQEIEFTKCPPSHGSSLPVNKVNKAQLETHPSYAVVQLPSYVKDKEHTAAAAACENHCCSQIDSDYLTSTKDIMDEECMLPDISNLPSARPALPLQRFVESDSADSPYMCILLVLEELTSTSYLAKSRIEPVMSAAGNRGTTNITQFISSKLPETGTHWKDPSFADNGTKSSMTSILPGPVEGEKDSLLNYVEKKPSVLHRVQGDGKGQRERLPGDDVPQQFVDKADRADIDKPGNTGDRSADERTQTPDRHSGSLAAQSSAPVFNRSEDVINLPQHHRLNSSEDMIHFPQHNRLNSSEDMIHLPQHNRLNSSEDMIHLPQHNRLNSSEDVIHLPQHNRLNSSEDMIHLPQHNRLNSSEDMIHFPQHHRLNSSEEMINLPRQHRLNQTLRSMATQTGISWLRHYTTGDENMGFNERLREINCSFLTANRRATATQTDISWLGDYNSRKVNEDTGFNKRLTDVNCLFLTENHRTAGTQTDISYLGNCKNEDGDMGVKKRHRESSCSFPSDSHRINEHSSSSSSSRNQKRTKLSDLQSYVAATCHHFLNSCNVQIAGSSSVRGDSHETYYGWKGNTTSLVGPVKTGSKTGRNRIMRDMKGKPRFSLLRSSIADGDVTEHDEGTKPAVTDQRKTGSRVSENHQYSDLLLPARENGSNSEPSYLKRRSPRFVVTGTSRIVVCSNRAGKQVGNDQISHTRTGRAGRQMIALAREARPNRGGTTCSGSSTTSVSYSNTDASEDNQKTHKRKKCRKTSHKRKWVVAKPRKRSKYVASRETIPNRDGTTSNSSSTTSISYSNTDASEDNQKTQKMKKCRKTSNKRKWVVVKPRKCPKSAASRETIPNRDGTASNSSSTTSISYSNTDASEDNQKTQKMKKCRKTSNKRKWVVVKPRKCPKSAASRETIPNRDGTASNSSSTTSSSYSNTDASEDNQKTQKGKKYRKASNKKKCVVAKPRKCPKSAVASKTYQAKRGRPRRRPALPSKENNGKPERKRRKLRFCSNCHRILGRKEQGRGGVMRKVISIHNQAVVVSDLDRPCRGNEIVIRWKATRPKHETDHKRPTKKTSRKNVKWIVPKGFEKKQKKRKDKNNIKHQTVPKSKIDRGENPSDASTRQRVRSTKKKNRNNKALFMKRTIPIAHVVKLIKRTRRITRMLKGLKCTWAMVAKTTDASLAIDPGVNLDISVKEETHTLSFSSVENSTETPSVPSSTGWCISREDGSRFPGRSCHEVDRLPRLKHRHQHDACVHNCSNNTLIRSQSSAGRPESFSRKSARITSPESPNGVTVDAPKLNLQGTGARVDEREFGPIFSFHNPLAGRGVLSGMQPRLPCTPEEHQPPKRPVGKPGSKEVSDAVTPERGNARRPCSPGSPKSFQIRQRENVSSFSGLGCSENISDSRDRKSAKAVAGTMPPSQLTPFVQGTCSPLAGQENSPRQERRRGNLVSRENTLENGSKNFETKQKVLSGRAGQGSVGDWEGPCPGGKEGHPRNHVRESRSFEQQRQQQWVQGHRTCFCCSCPSQAQRNVNCHNTQQMEGLRKKKRTYALARQILKKICYIKQKEEQMQRAAIRYQMLRLKLQEKHSMLFASSHEYSDSQHTDAFLRPSTSDLDEERQQQQRPQRRNSHQTSQRARPCPDHCATPRSESESGCQEMKIEHMAARPVFKSVVDNPQPSTSKAPSANGSRNVNFLPGNGENEDDDGYKEDEGEEGDGSSYNSKYSYYDDSQSRSSTTQKDKNTLEIKKEKESEEDETPDDDSNDSRKAGFFR